MADTPFRSTNLPSVGGNDKRVATTLETCTNLQSTNADYIDNISERINNLITKLRGYSPNGACGEVGLREAEGVLGDHKTALEYEARRLGEIQADLAVLEELL